jgi:hypothetical protein
VTTNADTSSVLIIEEFEKREFKRVIITTVITQLEVEDKN